MVNKSQKLWAHYEQIKTILEIYIILFFIVPILSQCFSYLSHSSDIDAGVQGAKKLAILSGLKWYGIIMPVITILFTIWFICFSGRVEFTDSSIICYKFLFSKKSREVFFDEISHCIFSDGYWSRKNQYVRGMKILIFNKNNIILKFDLYYKLCFELVLILGESKVRVMGKRYNFQTQKYNIQSLSTYYSVDFNALSKEQKFKILKHYCKLMKSEKIDLKKILK